MEKDDSGEIGGSETGEETERGEMSVGERSERSGLDGTISKEGRPSGQGSGESSGRVRDG